MGGDQGARARAAAAERVSWSRALAISKCVGDNSPVRGDNSRNQLLKLRHEVFPGYSFFGKLQVAVADIPGLGQCSSDQIIQASDDVQYQVAA
jgi:hypothetical protein